MKKGLIIAAIVITVITCVVAAFAYANPNLCDCYVYEEYDDGLPFDRDYKYSGVNETLTYEELKRIATCRQCYLMYPENGRSRIGIELREGIMLVVYGDQDKLMGITKTWKLWL